MSLPLFPTADRQPLQGETSEDNPGNEVREVVEFFPTDAGVVDVIEFDSEGRLPPFPGLRRPFASIRWLIQGAFGFASLMFMLAVIAAIPVVNFLALGYLLEVEGRVARSGRWRDGFPLLGLAPRIGSIALGVYLWLWPLRIIGLQAAAAHIIDPGSLIDRRWQTFRLVAAIVIGLHLCFALARGGSLGCFLRPLKNILWLTQRLWAGDYWATASAEIRDFVSRLRLQHHFSLGVRGFGVAFAWLALPTAIYAATNQPGGGAVLLLLTGGLLLVFVFAWTPLLQARFAAENRLRSGFELREAFELFRHAPFAWLITIVLTYVLAFPLYAFKAYLLPQDAMWLVTLVFVLSIYPLKLITGWAYHRSQSRRERELRSYWITRTFVRIALLFPVLGLYVTLFFFTQFLSQHGKPGMFEHHIFLLPVPF
ncbi:MAG: DUF4013 domain-containing protein [Planctomycetaceae bacterium]